MSNGPILARRGMAVSGHPLATMEAVRIMQHGGSFMDAGIAASAVLATALPQATSLGGDVNHLKEGDHAIVTWVPRTPVKGLLHCSSS